MAEYSDSYQEFNGAERTGFLSALTRERRWPFLDSMEGALVAFSPSERLALYLLAGILGASTLVLVSGVNGLATVTVPASGGTLLEGEIGSARFINPLRMLSQPDQDITSLVYSGLVRANPDGELVPDLAESYTISDDGRIYTFKLRKNATFHDGKSVHAADVVFTIEKAVDPAIISPRRADWTGVSVASPDEETVIFTLPHAYAPFLQNTNLGTLPKHLWENIPAEEFPFSPLNTHPIGSGPYKIDRVSSDATGAATRYDLEAFSSYTLGTPFLSHISFIFYPDMEALIKGLNSKTIDAAAGISPADLTSIERRDLSVVEVPLPRVFGVFFNQSHNPVRGESVVRRALEAAVDKKGIVQTVLGGRGQALNGPFPTEMLGASSPSVPHSLERTLMTTATSSRDVFDDIRTILSGGGWKFTSSASASSTESGTWTKGASTGSTAAKPLSFTLATADQIELVATGRALVAAWKKVGIQATLQIYSLSELNSTVIRPRSYDALLFGEVVGPELDLYAFWHSSQRNDPGLNLAMYANQKTDAILSEARTTTNESTRNNLYREFEKTIIAEVPAVFLYAPDFLYIVPDDLSGIELGALRSGAERFENAHHWYKDTENVWMIFAPLPASAREKI